MSSDSRTTVFTENTRVQIPAILTLIRMGYGYISLKTRTSENLDKETNIFKDVFISSLKKINPNVTDEEILSELETISLLLANNDLGKAFYLRLLNQTGIKLIDFENFEKNSFNVVAELPCEKDGEEFRPDITILINGMPLCFIEVKKPNNIEGIRAERKRMNYRFSVNEFRKFINISQILVFSNNMEYEDGQIEPLQGAFYATTSKTEAFFNYFREELKEELRYRLLDISNEIEDEILLDQDKTIIKYSPEFASNKQITTPTNRILLSLFTKERLRLLLMYGIAYVEKIDEDTGEKKIEKHILRYPQFFASKAIQRYFDKGNRKGIIWHTQGSGKTALTYFNVHMLIDYFSKKHIIPKFYFIVDRIELLEQAASEFSARGLKVHVIHSRNDFIQDMKSPVATRGSTGQREITVVNIQKFSDKAEAIEADYDFKVQRIYFIDEAHRSYNPKGSFLANLVSSDRNAMYISLTGTPLVMTGHKSTDIWGQYIHKYYYNQSVADGYTLRLVREPILVTYKEQLNNALRSVQVKEKTIEKNILYKHPTFCSAMLDYITKDLAESRESFSENTIAGMVVCHTSDQAKELYRQFLARYNGNTNNPINSALLILHDVGTSQERKALIKQFKNGKYDLIFVFNMLLTGFDSSRLKKLYFCRNIKEHNLLQALTRVNRPYKNFKYGYVVDFTDITSEFDKANKAYLEELNSDLGLDSKEYDKLLLTDEEIEKAVEEILDVIWEYPTDNSEEFSEAISKISDRNTLNKLKEAFDNAKDLYNRIIYSDKKDKLAEKKIDFDRIRQLAKLVENRIQFLRIDTELCSENTVNEKLLNEALEKTIFGFAKLPKETLLIADELSKSIEKTRYQFLQNFDRTDKKYIEFETEFRRAIKEAKIKDVSTQSTLRNSISNFSKIHQRILELNRQNAQLSYKYNRDKKYARIHKRIVEDGRLTNILSQKERIICEVLNSVKSIIDKKILNSDSIVKNTGFFRKTLKSEILNRFCEHNIRIDNDLLTFISTTISKEYEAEANDR